MTRVWKFGHNIDTDVITPGEYIHGHDPEEYAAHAMEPVRPEFGSEVEPGDIIVAGKNFGSGSSRESAPDAFLQNEVDCIIAVSFGRIFYRNAINIGLPVYICPEAYEGIEEGHEVTVDQDDGIIHNETTDDTYVPESHPEFIRDIIERGGLREYHQHLRNTGD
jgi:3-isopropylmalate/(R)-2-methylmalate dehydratase small subunit